jgi:hypothetical protein
MRSALTLSVLTACSASDGSGPPPATASNAQPAANKLVRTAGVTPLRSLPRADWPCRAEGTLPRMDTKTVRRFDYTDAPTSCLHVPDYWWPGCPRTIELKVDLKFVYDCN